MLKAQKIQKNQVQTPMSWMTVKGLVEVCFKEADAYVTLTGLDGNHYEIPLECQMFIPSNGFEQRNIPTFFSGVYPAVSFTRHGTPFITFIRKQVGDMQIFIKTLQGITYTLAVNPSDTIKIVKLKLQEKSQLPPERIRFIYNNKQLDNDRSLDDYNIQNQETLFMTQKLEGGTTIYVEFNKMENQLIKQFTKNAPNYRRVVKGLNLEGTCRNQQCEAFSQRVWVQKGFGLFHMNQECNDSLCPLCQEEVEDVTNAGFHNCMYSIYGKRQEDGKVVKVQRECILAPTNKLLTFKDQDEDISQWIFLNIKVEKREGIVELSFGKEVTLNLQKSGTIQMLKKEIEDKKGIQSDQIMMIYENRLLQDEKTLRDYNIKAESSIQIYRKSLK